MRLILYYAPSFWFKTYKKILDDVPDHDMEEMVENVVVVFYQAEEGDSEKKSSVISKFVKNVKWVAGKFDTKTIVLHSFSHLSMSKAAPELTNEIITDVKERLSRTGYTITETPFGYLNEWKMHVAGESLAKVFKEF
ncbi:MAG: threonyl-tRNA synthetase editing domain-containing protein [Thermodesulfovibrionia bacterium]|nr:threonyl-tRNA synthetase editing domain-containing protein [Thermodesulfovibrionia bacterium]